MKVNIVFSLAATATRIVVLSIESVSLYFRIERLIDKDNPFNDLRCWIFDDEFVSMFILRVVEVTGVIFLTPI
jgi:hypothetical protein